MNYSTHGKTMFYWVDSDRNIYRCLSLGWTAIAINSIIYRCPDLVLTAIAFILPSSQTTVHSDCYYLKVVQIYIAIILLSSKSMVVSDCCYLNVAPIFGWQWFLLFYGYPRLGLTAISIILPSSQLRVSSSDSLASARCINARFLASSCSSLLILKKYLCQKSAWETIPGTWRRYDPIINRLNHKHCK